MPQLNIPDYAPQLAWLVITFIALVLLMWKVALPRVRTVLEERERRIKGDLAKAEQLKEEAERLLEAYDTAIAEARGQAQSLIVKVQQEIAEDAAQRKAEIERELAAKAAEAEARIGRAKAEAMGEVQTLATEVARAATARLIGTEPDESAAGAAVAAELGRGGSG